MIGPFWVGDRPTRPIEIDLSRPGVPSDLAQFTSATAVVIDPDGDKVMDLFTVEFTPADMQVILNWNFSSATGLNKSGDYTIQLKLAGSNTSSEWVTPVTFIVYESSDSMQETWATVGHVKSFTGVDVDTPVLYQAQFVVEMFSRVSAENSWIDGRANPENRPIKIGRNDARLLRQAVAYQAAWMQNEPDMFYRSDVTGMSQDGVSAQFTDTGLTLAPLARIALDRLSWFGTRSTRSQAVSAADHASYVEWLDDQGDWKPLGFGGWKAV